MEILQLTQVSKSYGEKENRVQALKDISLSVRQGEFVAMSARPAAASRRF